MYILFFLPLYFLSCQSHNEMIYVPANDLLPGYYIDKFEVTLLEFEEFVEQTGYITHSEKEGIGIVFKGQYKEVPGVNWRHDIQGKSIPREDYANYPVTRINYYDALAFANWKGKSIPTIEQWYYAANGLSELQKYRYAGSNSINKVAWFDSNSNEQNQKIGTKAPNSIGLFDMSGNVAEMVLLSKDPDPRIQYVGGSFFDGKEEAELKYVKQKKGNELVSKEATLLWSKPNHGFRCVINKEK